MAYYALAQSNSLSNPDDVGIAVEFNTEDDRPWLTLTGQDDNGRLVLDLNFANNYEAGIFFAMVDEAKEQFVRFAAAGGKLDRPE